MRFGRAGFGWRLLVLGWVLAAKPSPPRGSFGPDDMHTAGSKTTWVYVCSLPTCTENIQRDESELVMIPRCFCGNYPTLYNAFEDGGFVAINHDHEIWVCIKCKEPPVRAGAPRPLRPGHTFERYAKRRGS